MNTVKIIIGPTASGKTALAVDRALAHGNACIINADAMQCYDALPILSAQPTMDERKGVPHHLFGFLDAGETLSAAGWVRHAIPHIEQALTSGMQPFVVGGTGFYIKALMHGMSPIPDTPPHIRQDLMRQLETQGLPALYTRLQTLDPITAARLKAGDTQRIIRALEVHAASGQPLSHWQSIAAVPPRPEWRFHVTEINPSKDVLATKITARLHSMIAHGVMNEVAALSARIDNGEIPDNAAITIAHGFRHFRAVLKGEMSLDDAIAKTALETRQYTKRQRTWLRNQLNTDETIT